ncbi:MAG: hypothetical protein IKC65_06935 [Lentisphaeria bacterium]|nr:hypothetical protein [Lentisphaeria bacterium]
MTLKYFFFIVAGTFFLSLNAAYIGYLYPAGGRAGDEVEILVGGQGCWGTRGIIVTGGGVKLLKLESVRGVPYPSGSQRRYLMRWVRQIEKGDRSFLPLPAGENGTVDWRYHPWYSKLHLTTPMQYELVTHFLFVPRNPLQMNPSIGQNLILKLKIDKNAAPGRRELRLEGGNWLSNPVPFYISAVPEVREPRFQVPPKTKGESSFTAPCVLNGQIMPGETDIFNFEAKKGETLYFDFKGRVLLPFMGDGVPGHFQACLEVIDSQKKRAAFADDRYFHPDPVMKFTAPETGSYKLLVRDALYRGRNDFVYRIEVDKNPRPYIIAPPPRFAVAPVTLDEKAGKSVLPLPVVISGTILKPGEKAVYRFHAAAGTRLVADVWARRLNSPLDGLLEILAPSGKRVAICDDVKRQRVGLVMQHTDPTILFTAPETGTYQAVLKDNAGAGGKDYKYYLRLDTPRPDFRVWGYPSALEPGTGGSRGDFGIIVERLDGFDGPVKIGLSSPLGYQLCGENTVPAKCNYAAFTIDSAKVRRPNRSPVRITASACGITREVSPADEAMQAFAYNHLIPCEGDFYVTRQGRYWMSRYLTWAEEKPAEIRLVPGSSTVIKMKAPKYLPPDFEILDIALKDQPLGVLVENPRFKNGIVTATVKATAEAAATAVNQIFLVNIRYTNRYRDGKTRKMVSRKARGTAMLPARRLVVATPPAKVK